MTAETITHQISLAVWDIPPAVAAGARFAVKAGVKSSAGCALGGCRIEVLDESGAMAGSGLLGMAPWPDTSALFWSEVELGAPSEPGPAAFAVRFDTGALDDPHEDASARFSVAVVAPPEHVLTVTVATESGLVADAIVRAGPVRAMTDAAGCARLHLAKGRYELAVWKAGFDAPVTPIAVESDAAVRVEALALPEADPDAAWTA